MLNFYFFNKSKKFHLYTIILGMVLAYMIVLPLSFIPSVDAFATSGYDIFDFQQAMNKKDMDTILESWQEHDLISDAISQTYFDFLFIIGNLMIYIGLFSLLGIYISNRFGKGIMRFIVNVSIFGSLFDIIENIFSLMVFNNYNDYTSSYPSSYPVLIWIFAMLKEFTTYLKIGVLVLGLIFIAYERYQKNKIELE